MKIRRIWLKEKSLHFTPVSVCNVITLQQHKNSYPELNFINNLIKIYLIYSLLGYVLRNFRCSPARSLIRFLTFLDRLCFALDEMFCQENNQNLYWVYNYLIINFKTVLLICDTVLECR